MTRPPNPDSELKPNDSKDIIVGSSVAARGFRRGKPASVQIVQERVRKIIAYRGYSIPQDQRADLQQEILAQLWSATRKPQFDESGGFFE